MAYKRDSGRRLTGAAALRISSAMPALSSRADYDSLTDCIYLNQASLGLVGRPAVAAMHRFLDEVARHGNMKMSDSDEVAFFETLRDVGAALLGCDPACLAILASASEMLSQLPFLFPPPPGGEILLVDSDFPALTRPWLAHAAQHDAALRFVEDRPGRDLTETLTAAIGPKTAVVAVSLVQFSTGTLLDIPRLRRASGQVGARLVVDVTQAAGALPLDAAGWGADVVVSSGYKWLGGHGGVALAALLPELLEAPPPAPGWMGAPDPFDFDATRLRLAAGARRYTQSTMSYISMTGLTVAIRGLLALGPVNIAAHAAALSRRLIEGLEGSGWTPYRGLEDPARAPHIVTLSHPTLDTAQVAARLRQAGIVCGGRNNRIRVSLAHYNDESDVGAVTDMLRAGAG